MKRKDFVLAGVASPLALALPELGAATSVGGTSLALVTADHESHVVALEMIVAVTAKGEVPVDLEMRELEPGAAARVAGEQADGGAVA